MNVRWDFVMTWIGNVLPSPPKNKNSSSAKAWVPSAMFRGGALGKLKNHEGSDLISVFTDKFIN
jgi:hypothetical protein